MNSFQKSNFYVAIGVCPTNGSCCVFIDSTPPPMILQPQSDRKYVIHTSFSFSAAKRVVLSTIVANLLHCEVSPERFCPPTNPDNRFYAGLSKDKLGLIIGIVRISIEGLCVGLVDDKPRPIYTETITPPEAFKKSSANAIPNITLDRDVAFILGETNTIVHTFIE